eukprot:CAMPEP_0170521406 /NCGR_PEP_ID=MMETSP0209-20121228/6763_1 /TAXON_ID=665100 ORGANISM="Litonotus pictus, Strain P1" /NCGR_SAMPLE_ID=MMETSP0209 /ASSEMBLY_ACC=CAM_ASM_000301 /LENGTH=263 /DNA_ID=CAMNT_0010808255 /DNA_START=33 /DNA_END=824 /DNA_ORIENTATION=+
MVIEFNRPKKMNAIGDLLFHEIKTLFESITRVVLKQKDVRCIVLTGSGGNFCSGLDLKSDIVAGFGSDSDMDIGRRGFWIKDMVDYLQSSMSSIENNPLPVLCAIEGYCLGGATSIMTCCDMRFSTKNSKISIREMEIGLTADLGVLQRMLKQVSNVSLFKQYCFTGEIFSGQQAYELGLVSKVFDTEKEMYTYVMELAKIISEKSPIVLWGVKKVINFSRDNHLNSSLELVGTLNSALVQSNDIMTAVAATIQKEKKVFPKF